VEVLLDIDKFCPPRDFTQSLSHKFITEIFARGTRI